MMKYKKATKIVAAVVLGTQILALLLTFILMMNVSAFAATDEEFTVTYLYGTKSVEQTVKLGGNGRPPRDTAVKGYTFIGWSDTARHVTKDMVILGMYTNNTMYKASTTAASKVKKFNNNKIIQSNFLFYPKLKNCLINSESSLRQRKHSE